MRAFAPLLAGLMFFNTALVFSQDNAGETAADAITVAEQGMLWGETPPSVAAPGPSIGAVIRVILTLVLAAAAIYGVVFLLKRKAKKAEITDPFLKVLASSHLGLNRYVHVVSVGSKAWLVGAGEGGVSLISEIEDRDVLDAMFIEEAKTEVPAPSGRFPDFRNMLSKLGVPVDGEAPGTDSIRKRRERLKGL